MQAGAGSVEPSKDTQVPLVIDLDGTLIRSDLLAESTFSHLGSDPLRLAAMVAALGKGKAALKAHIASATMIDVTHLPYDEDVLALIRVARTKGIPVYLASASNERYVAAVSDHLGLFDGWFASDDQVNLSAETKAGRLVEAFGQGGFDYVGNDAADLPVWAAARRRTALSLSPKVRSALLAIDADAVILPATAGQGPAWTKLLRVHQWAKNALVLVPLLTAHRFDLLAIFQILGAFIAFSFAASGVYILNDLVDIDADRHHPSKQKRPLAAGTVPILRAISVAPLLIVAALICALVVSPWLCLVLAGYLALTTAYSFVLKRKLIIDVIVLASLYTVRVMGGAAALSVVMSEWLIAFSMLIFTALALIKRYTELAARLDADLPDPSNRDYRKTDLDIISALAAAASFNAITVFALYVSSDAATHLYAHPKVLWLVCPVLMYWLARALTLAHRRQMHDDPIVFALTDRNSLIAFGLIALILLGAI